MKKCMSEGREKIEQKTKVQQAFVAEKKTKPCSHNTNIKKASTQNKTAKLLITWGGIRGSADNVNAFTFNELNIRKNRMFSSQNNKLW